MEKDVWKDCCSYKEMKMMQVQETISMNALKFHIGAENSER